MNLEENLIKKIIGKAPEEQYKNSEEEFSLEKIVSKMPDEGKPNRNKKDSSINEIVGRTEEEKEKVREYFAKRFSNQKWEELKEIEIEKTKWQIKMINFVNDETNKLMEKYGLEKFDIKPENVHLFKDMDFEKLFGDEESRAKDYKIRAFFTQNGQASFLNEGEFFSKIEFARRVFHEFIHFKGFQNVLADVERDKNILPQAGICLDFEKGNGNQEKERISGEESAFESLKREMEEVSEPYFGLLNEAVAEELAKRFQRDVLRKHPDFKEETDLLNELAEYQKQKGIKIDRDEVISIKKVNFWSPDDNQEKTEYRTRRASYKKSRIILNKLIEALYENNKNKFQNQEEVFDLFAKSLFTGNIVGKGSWGRMIDETFGGGTLKKIGRKDANIKELKEFIKKLGKKQKDKER